MPAAEKNSPGSVGVGRPSSVRPSIRPSLPASLPFSVPVSPLWGAQYLEREFLNETDIVSRRRDPFLLSPPLPLSPSLYTLSSIAVPLAAVAKPIVTSIKPSEKREKEASEGASKRGALEGIVAQMAVDR